MTIRHLKVTHTGVATRDWRGGVPEDIRKDRMSAMARSLAARFLEDPTLFTITEGEPDENLDRFASLSTFTLELYVVTKSDAECVVEEAGRRGARGALNDALDMAGGHCARFGTYACETFIADIRKLMKEYDE